MAGGNTAYDTRDFYVDSEGVATPAGKAGLNEPPPGPRRRLNLSFTPEPPDPRPSFSMSNKDVRKTFGVGLWDQFTGSPEWQAAKKGAPRILAERDRADTWKADRPTVDKYEVEDLDEEIKAAKSKVQAAAAAEDWDAVTEEGKRVKALEERAAKKALNDKRRASDPNRLYAGANAEKKKVEDEIKRLKTEKAKTWAGRRTTAKNIAKGSALTAALGGAAWVGGRVMDDAEEARRNDPTKLAVDKVVMRIIGGEDVSPDDIYMMEQFYADEPEKVQDILRVGEEARAELGGGAPPLPLPSEPPPAPVGPRIDALPQGPVALPQEAGLQDVAYREGAEKPEVDWPERTYNPKLMRGILEHPDGGPELALKYKDEAEAEDTVRRNNAFLDASIENTAAAAGSPDWFMDYLRGQGEQSRAVDAGGELPTSDNWWNNWVVPTVQAGDEGWQRLYGRIDQAFPDDPATFWENPIGYTRNAMVPEDWQDSIDSALEGVTPQDMLGINFLLGQTTDEWKNLPYALVRDGILSPALYAELLETPALEAGYGEALRSMGGEPLRGPDPMTAPIAKGAAPPAFWDTGVPPELSAGADVSGTGTQGMGMPSMEELAQLEQIGALGVNPDGSNMTVAQYIQQGNLAGAGMEAGMPMFSGTPMPTRRGTTIPEDPRLGPMPRAVLPQLPMAPSDMPIEVIPPQGTPGAFLDENARDFRRADMEWQRLATMLGQTPTGEPTSGRLGLNEVAPVAPASPPPPPPTVPPGGPGDQWALTDIFGSPAYAGETDVEDPELVAQVEAEIARQEAAREAAEGDEVLSPKGAGALELPGPSAASVPISREGLSMGQPAERFDPITTEPTAPADNRFNASRERGVAGLADDAAAAEEELNWINRFMRDKMGMTDASQRAKAAEALISFGSTVLASRGDDWQAIGEGLQAGLGTVTQINDEEAAALAAAQEAALEDSRWRAEMALKSLNAKGNDEASKLDRVGIMAQEILLMNPGMTEQAAWAMAERYLGIKSQADWEQNDFAWGQPNE